MFVRRGGIRIVGGVSLVRAERDRVERDRISANRPIDYGCEYTDCVSANFATIHTFVALIDDMGY